MAIPVTVTLSLTVPLGPKTTLLVLIVAFFRTGILPSAGRLWRRWQDRRISNRQAKAAQGASA